MASLMRDSSSFFLEGTASQFNEVLSLYPEVLRLKAESKKKPEELIKLDNWYQNELPKKIKSRGKDAHCNHEELVQLMKWKQTRGKFYPQVNYLVKVNTPRAVLTETKKALKKLPNLEQAITALNNLKGVGTTMASALLAAAAPEIAPFMADECLLSIPEIEGIDYTTKEYLNFVSHVQNTANRLNKEPGCTEPWTLHKVELALWTHFVAKELKPELLDNIPHANGSNNFVNISHQNGDSTTDSPDEDNDISKTSNVKTHNKNDGAGDAVCSDDVVNSVNEDSLEKVSEIHASGDFNDEEVTNDSVITSDSTTNDSIDIDHRNNSVLNINEETCSSFLEPPSKKVRLELTADTEENSAGASDVENSSSSVGAK